MNTISKLVLVGTFLNTFFCLAQPGNDDCANAIPVFCGDTLSGTTTNATFDSIPGCGSGALTIGGVWYLFAGTGDDVTISTCNMTTYDSKIDIYDGTCGALNCIAGNDDAGCPGFSSEVTFNSVLGTDYFIFIHGFGTASGDFDMAVSCSVPPTPVANDECDSVIVLTEELACNYTTASVFGATETIPSDSCNNFLSAAALDVWFSFVCTNPVTTIEVDPMFDPVLQLRDACGGGNILGCSDNVGVTDDEFITASNLVVGNTYYVRVYPYGSNIPANPNFNICVYEGQYVGITEVTLEEEFKLYPNPTSGILYIDYNLDIEGTMHIINGIGQIVMSEQLSNSVSLANLEKGIYLVKITDNKGKILCMERVVLQ